MTGPTPAPLAGSWPDDEPPAHSERAGVVVRRLAADPVRGLGEAEVAQRLARFGPNRLPEPARPSELRRILRQLASPIVLTLLAAAGIAAAVGAGSPGTLLARFGDSLAIGIVVVLNATLGWLQERRAESAIAALGRLQAPRARVRREGAVRVVSAADLVPGDVLELEAGDAVPADARLVEARDLSVDESALTGESVAVAKDAAADVDRAAPLAEHATMLHLGTSVVRGKGTALVVATGARTEIGRIGAMMGAMRAEPTPLEQRLAVFGRRVLWACLVVSAVLFVWGALVSGRGWLEVLLESVSFAVAAIPEGLPAVTTITLAVGVQRMARRGAIVRRLHAVEALGAATVLCTDKTGTLTCNEMTVRELWLGGSRHLVTGEGYDPRGEILQVVHPGECQPHAALPELLECVTLCNSAGLAAGPNGPAAIGDPTEAALLVLAQKGGVDVDALRGSFALLREVPFDPERRRMTVVGRRPDGSVVGCVKGALDAVLERCTHVLVGEVARPIDPLLVREAVLESERMSGDALRVLAVARALDPDPELPERELCLLGLVGMADPPRSGAKEAVAACQDAGIRVVMITGDHALTARAIARDLGIAAGEDEVTTGSELDGASDAELEARVERLRVFARTSPLHKLRIVRALRARGHVVAMTGDGVNDAPALREAHIGVAMGRSGTDVARQAADIVLTDDDFTTLVDAVREGRAIYRNIQKSVFFLLSSNAGLAFAVFAVALVPGWLPLSPLMILWINLVTNGLPALALGVDQPGRELMREPPRRTRELLAARDWLGVAYVGVLMALGAVAAQARPVVAGHDASLHRTLAFTVLALAPLAHAWSCRSPRESIFNLKPLVSPALLAACAASALVQLFALLVPGMRPVFGAAELGAREWILALCVSLGVVGAVEAAKAVERALGAWRARQA